jgi:pimeloyl-ACP methyl ester carboxylesterase
MVAGLALVVYAGLSWADQSYGQSDAHKPRGGSHLYVLLGFLNNSPGLSELAQDIAQRGIPTTVRNYSDWPTLAREAIDRYKSGRLYSVMIVGHSLGGRAALEMAADLGRSGVPVRLVVTLDPTGGSRVLTNVRRTINFRPRGHEDHFSVIAAHRRDLIGYVLGSR